MYIDKNKIDSKGDICAHLSKQSKFKIIGVKMSVDDLDLDYLISLVQERPALWDKSNEDYSNKFHKQREWLSICKLLFPHYNDFDDKKKNEIGNDIVKKWRSVKDNFFRYIKRIRESSTSGSGAKKIKKYHFFNQLQFLMKVAQNKSEGSIQEEPENPRSNETPTRVSQSPTTPAVTGLSRYVPTSRKRPHGLDDFETQTLECLKEKENRHLSFFKGILPSLDNFTELQTLTFQSRVIQIITEMRYGQHITTSSTPSTSYGYQTAQYQGNNTPNSSRSVINSNQTTEYQENNDSSNTYSQEDFNFIFS